MKEIARDPMKFYPIAKSVREVYAQYTCELLAKDINEHDSDVSNGPYELRSDKSIIRITADKCEVREEKKLRLSGNVNIIEQNIDSKEALIMQCSRAYMEIEGDELFPTLTLDIRNAKLQKPDGSEDLLARHIIRGLVLPDSVRRHFKSEGNPIRDISMGLIRNALNDNPSENLVRSHNELRNKIDNTFAEIQAETHSRLVFGIGCITLILFGIALGIVLKGGHLLTAFAASVIPAMGLIVCIMMGKNITKNPGSDPMAGIILMWAGLAVLTILMIGLYRRLLKN